VNKQDLIHYFTFGTDNHYVLGFLLAREGWVNVIEIIRGHGRGNECNFAARSRISDVNKKIKFHGFIIESHISKDNHQAEYRIIEQLYQYEPKTHKELKVTTKPSETQDQMKLF
jgi:hypothetical protein